MPSCMTWVTLYKAWYQAVKYFSLQTSPVEALRVQSHRGADGQVSCSLSCAHRGLLQVTASTIQLIELDGGLSYSSIVRTVWKKVSKMDWAVHSCFTASPFDSCVVRWRLVFALYCICQVLYIGAIYSEMITYRVVYLCFSKNKKVLLFLFVFFRFVPAQRDYI